MRATASAERVSHPSVQGYIGRVATIPERWPSGLRRTLGKRVYGKPYRGFESHPLRHSSKFFSNLAAFGQFYPRLYLRPEISYLSTSLKCGVYYILFLNAGIACRPTKTPFARSVKPVYQGCISCAQPLGCVASRVSVSLV